MKHLSIILAFLITLCSPVAGQDFYKGLVAYEANDFAAALKEFTPLAEAGNAYAQSMLGFMYDNGKGVLQDNAVAHMWYNIASANGDTDAREWRDERAGLMTPAAIEKAQAMARECMSSGYTKCGE